jgi:hypothetical protein
MLQSNESQTRSVEYVISSTLLSRSQFGRESGAGNAERWRVRATATAMQRPRCSHDRDATMRLSTAFVGNHGPIRFTRAIGRRHHVRGRSRYSTGRMKQRRLHSATVVKSTVHHQAPRRTRTSDSGRCGSVRRTHRAVSSVPPGRVASSRNRYSSGGFATSRGRTGHRRYVPPQSRCGPNIRSEPALGSTHTS